jgi:uncharacterized protein
MIQRSFVHIPGIGAATEKKLWERGLHHWEDLRREAEGIYQAPRAELIRAALNESEVAYRAKDLYYFYRTLPRDALWRLIPEFLGEIAYLDIETTGMGFPPMAHTTTITFYYQAQVYQEHEPAKKARLVRKMLLEPAIWVSFFGEGFDVPFLEREFGFELEKAHIDLCFWLKRLGFKGGLKKVQKQFKEIPARSSLDIDGFDAVRLWRLHEKGTPRALETLLTYNAEDTVVLEPLLIKAFNMEVDRHPEFDLEVLPMPQLPQLTTSICHEVYTRLRGH